jgi:hypothetical protein
MIQKGLDLGRTEFLRMALSMKQDELPDPVTVSVFRIWTEMAAPTDGGEKVE